MTTVDRPTPPLRTHKKDRKWVGKSIRRVEDPKFLRGRGGYVGDMTVPGMLHAAVLRSPHAHARIVSIDTTRGRRGARGARGDHRRAGGRGVRPDAGLRAQPRRAHLALPGPGQGALRRRGGRGRRRRQPLPGRGRAGADRRRVRAAAAGPRRAARAVRGRPAGARRARLQLRLRAHLPVRRGRPRLRRGRRGRHRPAALAALRRAAAGDGRRDRRFRPRHRLADRAHQLAELHQLPVHGGRHDEDPGQQAGHPAAAGRRQLRLQAVRDQTGGDRRAVLARGRPAGDVPGGPGRQHLQLRPPRLGPGLRRAARRDARRHHARHQDRHGGGLRRLHPVRGRAPRQRAGPGRRAVPDRQRRVPGAGGAVQQEPAGRLPGLRLRGEQLDARAAGRQGGPRAGHRPGGDAPAQLHPRVPALHPDRQLLRLRRLRRRAGQGARARRLRALARRAGQGPRGGPLPRASG